MSFKRLKFPAKGEARSKRGKTKTQRRVKRNWGWMKEAAFGEAEKAQGGWKKGTPKWSDLDE
jgi:hypothetical protein